MSKKVYVDLSQKDVQDIINAYEKDIEKFNKQKEVLDKVKEIAKENIDDEFYINLTKKEKALYKIHDLLEEIE